MLTEMGHDEDLIHDVWLSDEARFYLDGFVNKKIFRYWPEETPGQPHHQPLYNEL
jgi:hypothetical protein